jgi:uncharacterized protein YdhG (YjbR/CyaY superfamily)
MARTVGSTANSTKRNPTDVDAYIAAAPQAVQAQLRQLRALIKAEAPFATEKMSYGIPFYEYGVKPGTFASRLIYFSAQKKHIAIYPAGNAKGLEEYLTERSTLRFPLDKPLPTAKIRALVKARVKERDAALAKQTGAGARPSRSVRSAS